MSLPDDFTDLLRQRGIELWESHGVADIALSREDALAGVEMLEEAGRVILGGDVLFKVGEQLSFALANWSSKSLPGESDAAWAAHAAAESRAYITAFTAPAGRQAMFALVVKV